MIAFCESAAFADDVQHVPLMNGMRDRSSGPRPWGTETLREYLLAHIDNLEKRTELRLYELNARLEQRHVSDSEAIKISFDNAEKAIAKSEAVVEKRFESAKESHRTLCELSSTMLPRAESDARLLALNARMDGLSSRIEMSEARLDKREGSKISGFSNQIGLLVVMVAVVLTLVSALAFLRQDDPPRQPGASLNAPATPTR